MHNVNLPTHTALSDSGAKTLAYEDYGADLIAMSLALTPCQRYHSMNASVSITRQQSHASAPSPGLRLALANCERISILIYSVGRPVGSPGSHHICCLGRGVMSEPQLTQCRQILTLERGETPATPSPTYSPFSSCENCFSRASHRPLQPAGQNFPSHACIELLTIVAHNNIHTPC